MRLIAFLIPFCLSIHVGYAQQLNKRRILPYSNKKQTYISLKGGLTSTQIKYESAIHEYSFIELYGGLSLDRPISKNMSIETDILFSYFGTSHFIELPLKFKFFISPKTNILTGISPNFLLDALATDSMNTDLYGGTKVFGLSGLLGVQYYHTKHWFIEAYYSHGFISQFNNDLSNHKNGVRHTFRIGIGYILDFKWLKDLMVQ